ncbi:hypothetical protein QN345_11955, partial [Cryobacterium sp. 10I1]|nr:hypothetical protein [Cryobacterium sp. 10I1]
MPAQLPPEDDAAEDDAVDDDAAVDDTSKDDTAEDAASQEIAARSARRWPGALEFCASCTSATIWA